MTNMRISSKKLLVGVIALLVLFATSFAILSFTLADESTDDGRNLVFASSKPQTIIDYIIDNSLNDQSTDKTYHILELGSSDQPSSLYGIVTSDKFRTLVLNAHKSENYTGQIPADTAAQKYFDYTYYNATSLQKITVKLDTNGDPIVVSNNNGVITYDIEKTAATDAEIVQAIQKADFCYLSNDPTDIYKQGHDITEDVKIALKAYATSDCKPLVIDSHNFTLNSANITSLTMEGIATNDFSQYGPSKNTYKWDPTISVSRFMDLTNMVDLYIPIDGDQQINTWTKIRNGNSVDYLAKVLTINVSGSKERTLTDKMLLDHHDEASDTDIMLQPYVAPTASATDASATDAVDASTLDLTNTYALTTTSELYNFGYVGRAARPTALKFDTFTIPVTKDSNGNDVYDPSGLKDIDYNQYDFVVIEGDTKNVDFALYIDSYNALISAMENYVHILYNKNLITQVSNGSVIPCTAGNYSYVYDQVADATDKPKFGYIMVTSRSKFATYNVDSITAAGMDAIAKIINNGTFRGIGGPDDDGTANIYTALEIEPCYPIDTTLAEIFENKKVRDFKDDASASQYNNTTLSFAANSDRATSNGKRTNEKGFYYLRTSSVSDKTSDEISFDGGQTSLTTLLESYKNGDTSLVDASVTEKNNVNLTDYYKWTLSKAKVAHALGVTADQVKVIHMSSQEFAASKDTVLDNYDMIYIGGDYSAFTEEEYLTTKKAGLEYYKMYRHNGDVYYGTDSSNLAYPDQNGKENFDTIGVTTGNDITDDKLKELKAYIDADMPLVIGKDVTASYNSGSDIDPYSNMYELLTYATRNDCKDTTVWDFDYDSTVRIANTNNAYGDTFGGYVTVFSGLAPDMADTNATAINNLKNIASDRFKVDAYENVSVYTDDTVVDAKDIASIIRVRQRPRLACTVKPTKYNEGDPSTWISVEDVKFVYNVNLNMADQTDVSFGVGTIPKYKDVTSIYIDDDSNNRFTEDEKRATATSENTLTCKLPSDYYGVIYWKLKTELYEISYKKDASGKYTNEIETDGSGNPVYKKSGQCAATTGVCKVARGNQEKMEVNLLQILPGTSQSTNNKTTLIFCTECQQTKGVMYGNRQASVGKYSKDTIQGLSSGFHDTNVGNNFTETNDSQTIASIVGNGGTIKNYENNANFYFANNANLKNYLSYNNRSNILGVHEHKFGIVKYDGNYPAPDDPKVVGLDDWNTNWFDEVKNDYNVYTTIMTTTEYDNAVAMVNQFYSGMSDADIETYSNRFATERDKYKEYYLILNSLINGDNVSYTSLPFTIPDIDKFSTCVSNLDTFLLGSDNGDTVANIVYLKAQPKDLDSCKEEIALETNPNIPGSERNYYDLFSMCNAGDQQYNGSSFYAQYSKLYQVWRNAKVYEQYFREMYVKYSILAAVNKDGNYRGTFNVQDAFNCVVVGAADDFEGDNGAKGDLNQASCNSILDYIDDDGNVFLLHDSLTSKKEFTQVMSRELREAFGQDPRHLRYTGSLSNTQIDNVVTVKIGNKTKKVSLSPNENSVTLKATAGQTTLKDQELYIVGHYRNKKPDQTSTAITLASNVTSADLDFVIDDQGNIKRVELNNKKTQTGTVTGHDIVLTPRLVKENGDLWNRYYTPQKESDYYVGELQAVDLYIDGKTVSIPKKLVGDTSISVPNGSVSGFTIEETARSKYGDLADQKDANGDPLKFTDSTAIDQYIYVNYVDKDGNPLSGSVTATNVTINSTSTQSFDADGKAQFMYKNINNANSSVTGVTAKQGYKNSEYFISPTLGGKIPNTYTLTIFKAFFGIMDSGGSVVLPYKYSWFNNQISSENAIQSQQDNRAKVHGGLNVMSDKTSQTNKGIVTMYPFAIGNQMQISPTTPQSYAVDIEDEDLTVFYTIAGGTAGTVSSLFAADPHDGANNYFIYQYHNVTYCGAGHSNITGYGKENNDERRLFINVILNSARKTTIAPELNLYDIDSTEANLKNNVIQPLASEDADYVTYITDIADEVSFDYLATKNDESTFEKVTIFWDKNRDGVAKNQFSNQTTDNPQDVLIYTNVGSDGKKLSTDDNFDFLKQIKIGTPGLAMTGTTPNLVLRDDYFDVSKRAYIVVKVDYKTPNGELRTLSKTLRIEYKPELLDLN